MTVGITGAAGFVGWHLRCLLSVQEGVTVRLATRDTFADPAALRDFVDGLDAVVHLAGISRAPDEELHAGNRALAEELVAACEAAQARPHVVMASSTHVERETLSAYGRGKQEAADVLTSWGSASGATVTVLVIPHVFGEYGRPHYNSAVATFAHQLATGETPVVNGDAPLELLHVQDLAGEIWRVLQAPPGGTERLRGTASSVETVLGQLQAMKALYETNVFPDLADPFAVRLFNTYRAALYPAHYPVEPPLYADPRGHLFETVKVKSGGQCFVSTTVPGITRGNHFHRFKVERFFVLSGRARIEIRKLFSDHVESFEVDGDRPAFVDIPTLQTHNITNIGEEPLVTLFWTHEFYDPDNSDTYPLTV